MPKFQPKTAEYAQERMINRIVARTDLNDVNDGSSLKQEIGAVSREIDDAYYQMINLQDLFDISRAIGRDLVERGKEFNPRLIGKLPAKQATSQVIFGRVGTVGSKTIQTGTQIKVPASGGQAEILFTTTEEGTIPNTQQFSGLVSVTANEPGTSGNVALGAIKGFSQKPSGIDSVTNPAAVTNGADLESDDAYRKRLLNQLKGLARSHVAGLEAASFRAVDPLSGKTVKFVNVFEDPIQRGNVTVYIDDGSGGLSGDTNLETDLLFFTAIGGETVLNLPNRPIRIEDPFTLKLNGTPMVDGSEFTLNPASGQINILSSILRPAGLIAGDQIRYTGTNFTGLIAETQKVIDGDPGDRSTYPGYRAAGILVRVLTPMIQFQTVELNITVLSGFNQVTIAAKVASEISAYINALGIGDDVILNEMRERTMAIPGMFDCEFVTPAGNTVILDNQMARILSNGITVF